MEYAGMLRPCLIDFGTERYRIKYPTNRIYPVCGNRNYSRMTRTGWTDKWLTPYHPSCDHPSLTPGIFAASRAARQELETLFFSHNRFTISLSSKKDYKEFVLSTRFGLQHLKYLNVNLGQLHYRYLKLAESGYHRVILNIWANFCQNAMQKMPSLRQFSMKCKVRDLEVASRIIRTMDPFPTLLHCAFHFAETQDDDIQPVIRRAAWRLTGRLNDDGLQFPFMMLPKEVQLMILEYLLIQHCDPYLPSSERAPSVVGFLDRKIRPTVNSPLACCGTCSPSGARCFCETSQTAFSTSCTCFRSPLPYFLVSRQFYQDCHSLFFSRNHFTLMEDEPEPIMRILTSIPTYTFMQIRHLSFKFPLVWRPLKSAKSENAVLLSWSVLRRFILEHFDIPLLSLYIVDLGSRFSSPGRSRFMRRMLKEFTALQNLRDFRVYLADDPAFEKELEQAVTGRKSPGRYRPYNMPFLGSTQNGSY